MPYPSVGPKCFGHIYIFLGNLHYQNNQLNYAWRFAICSFYLPNRVARELDLSEGTGGMIEEFDATTGWCEGTEGGRCILELLPFEDAVIWLLGLETGGVGIWLDPVGGRDCFSTVAGISRCFWDVDSLFGTEPKTKEAMAFKIQLTSELHIL